MDLTLVTIVAGLGLTELLLTFYRLIHDRHRIVWDTLPLAWALLILIAVVNYWWGTRAIMADVSGWTTGDFMLSMIPPIFLFLACAAALPRFVPGGPKDMKVQYAEQRAAFLIFFLAYQGGNWLLDISGLTGGFPPPVVLVHRSAVCVGLGLALIARSRRWDWVAVGIVAGAYALRLFTQIAR